MILDTDRNDKGIKYFMYLISQNKDLPYIDTDIRKIIWDYVFEPFYILCTIQKELSIKLMISCAD